MRAEKILQERLFEKKNVEFIWNSEVKEVLGDNEKKVITSLEIFDSKNNKQDILNVEGFFVAIGHSPTTEIFHKKLKMDDEGYIITSPDSTATNINGVFAAGDVKDKVFRQAITAAGMGCMAALDAEKWLQDT